MVITSSSVVYYSSEYIQDVKILSYTNCCSNPMSRFLKQYIKYKSKVA